MALRKTENTHLESSNVFGCVCRRPIPGAATSLPQSPNSTPKAARRVQFALPQGDPAASGGRDFD